MLHPRIVVGEYYETHPFAGGDKFFRSIEQRVAGEPEPWPTLTDYAVQSSPDGTWTSYDGRDLALVSKRFVYVPIFNYDDYIACSGSCTSGIPLQGVAMFFISFVGCVKADGSESPIYDEAGSGCAPGKGILRGSYIEVAEKTSFIPRNNFGTQVERMWQ